MKILFTGGGSGGHFYPIIAIAESVHDIIKEKRLLAPELYYFATEAYDKRMLFDNSINFVQMPAGKFRRYFSPLNFFDLFKTAVGIVKSLWKVFKIYPDVIFGKGGYSSFPALFAGKVFRIPVVIHESDSVPGKVNLWAGKFAESIAVSFSEAASYFPKDKVAHTGNPVRREILNLDAVGAHDYFNFDQKVQVIFILGGSQGARLINETILEILPDLLERYQIIHQTGEANIAQVSNNADVVLSKSAYKWHYKAFGYLDDFTLKAAASISSLVISRAGSTIFEIAAWEIPSILIPILDSNGDHQLKNAFNYARSGGAVVIEESNLKPHVLLSEINRLFDKPQVLESMRVGAKNFARVDAAHKIANKLLEIALTHET